MQTLLLHLDNALLNQEALLTALPADTLALDARDLGGTLRLWARPQALGQLRMRLDESLSDNHEPLLSFIGSGDFHHISALLLERLLHNKRQKPLSIIHFDNHPDWVRFKNGLHCGSWAAYAARLRGVNHIISIGMCSDDMLDAQKSADIAAVNNQKIIPFALKSFGAGELNIGTQKFQVIPALSEDEFITRVRNLIQDNDIYLTIDKDVLAPEHAATNWDQGQLSLGMMFSWLEQILAGKKLCGADVVGDISVPAYGPNLLAKTLKWAEAKLDQPPVKAIPDTAIALNSTTNIAIYKFLSPYLKRD